MTTTNTNTNEHDRYISLDAVLPETITVDFQPYGRVTLGQLELGQYNNYPLISGIVIEGTETSRMFQYTSTKDITGQRRTVYGVTKWELELGKFIRVAM